MVSGVVSDGSFILNEADHHARVMKVIRSQKLVIIAPAKNTDFTS